jgi:tripartite-type tricarboxylate transporter receptor subunit TctC
LNAQVAKVVTAPDMVERLAGQGVILEASSAEQLTAVMKGDLTKWAKVVKAADIHIN